MQPDLGPALLQLQKLTQAFRHRRVHRRETHTTRIKTAQSKQGKQIFKYLRTRSPSQIDKVISKVSRNDHFALEFLFIPIEA
jgi:hypothetical protein